MLNEIKDLFCLKNKMYYKFFKALVLNKKNLNYIKLRINLAKKGGRKEIVKKEKNE